jgi:hypothetical protein
MPCESGPTVSRTVFRHRASVVDRAAVSAGMRVRGGGSRPQVEPLVHVESEGAARVDVRPEQGGRAAPVLVRELLRPRRFGQDLLHQQGVDVDQRGLKQVQGEQRGFGVLLVRAG